MTRLQHAEQQLDEALRALESAVETVRLNAVSDTRGTGDAAGENAALRVEIDAIEGRLSEAIQLIADAGSSGLARGGS